MTTNALRRAVRAQLSDFLALIKVKQTALLVLTGLCAYVLSAGMAGSRLEIAGVATSLFLAISGCTALNMVLDRDVDSQMTRTVNRPLPAGRLTAGDAVIFGVTLTTVGLTLSFALDWRFGSVVLLGLGLDLLVYTIWLKRLTPLSIVFGGIAGGMPALAGRVLALGRVDLIGLLLAGAILLWIPSHILTLATRHASDYRQGGVPMWPLVYGQRATRVFIATTTLLNAIVFTLCAALLKIHWLPLLMLIGMSAALFTLSVFQIVRPTEQRNWLLFKAASAHMLFSVLCLTVGAIV